MSPAEQEPISDVERQRLHFNSIADRYRQERQGANHLLLKQLMWNRFFERAKLDERLADRDVVRVLEPMCGYCDGKHLLDQHLSRPIEYSGYDYSDTVVNQVNEDNPDINCWSADATSFAPDENAYDLIIILGGLHHIPKHAEHALSMIARGLRPGGMFINLEPTHGNPVTKFVRDRIYWSNDLFDEQTEEAFPVGSLFSMFRANGLERRMAMYPGLLSYVLYYNPDAFPGLNLGGEKAVRSLFALDGLFMHNAIGRTFSFATLSLWQRPA